MEARPDVRIDLAYEEGLHARVMTASLLPAELEPAMDNYASMEWLPAFETLPVLWEAFEAAGLKPEISAEAQALRLMGDGLIEQDDAMGRWVAGEDGPALPRLRARLKPHQIQGAAFLAFRGRGLLADPRPLNPVATMVAACEIVRAREEGARVIIVSVESRFGLWQQVLRELTGGAATVATGSKAHRRDVYDTASSYLLLTAEELVKDRAELETDRPQVVVLDELARVWGLASKTLDAVRRLEVGRIFGLVSVDAAHEPEALYGFLALLSPALVGPRQIWENRYLDRSVKGQVKVVHEGELRGRIAPFVLRRELDSIPAADRPTARDVRLVPLSRPQRTAYDRAQRSLLTLLGKRSLNIPDQRRAEDLLAQMREVCDSPSMRDDNASESAKLVELRYLLEETSAAKIVVFSRWEAMTREISELLKQLKLNHVRHYRKLPIKRREGLLERFRDEADVRVLLTTDTDLHLTGLKADMLIHFDAPWDPGVVTWRRAQFAGDAAEEVAIIADDTVEEALWSLPKPASHEAHSIEEEEAGIVGIHLFGRHSSNLLRLKRLMGLDPVPLETREENPAMAEVVVAAIEAHRVEEAQATANQAAATVDAAGKASPGVAAGEGVSSPEAVGIPSSPEAPAPEMVAEAAEEQAVSSTEAEPTGEMVVSSAERDTEPAAGPVTAPIADASAAEPVAAPAVDASAAGPVTPPASDTPADEPVTAPAAEEPSAPTAAESSSGEGAAVEAQGHIDTDSSSTSQEAPGGSPDMTHHSSGPLEDILLQLEIPLKAANRILAGVPVIGESLSMVNATLWELLASRFRNR